MKEPLRMDKISLGGGVMGALGSIACLLTLMGVPGMNWFLVATLAAGAAFGLTLAYVRRR
jgi:hypothetical protein